MLTSRRDIGRRVRVPSCRGHVRHVRLRRPACRRSDDRVRGAGGQRRKPRNRGEPAGNSSEGAGRGAGNKENGPRPHRSPPAAGHVLFGRITGVRAGGFGKRSNADHVPRGEGRLRNPQRRDPTDLCLAALQERHFRVRPSAGQGGQAPVLRVDGQWPAADSCRYPNGDSRQPQPVGYVRTKGADPWPHKELYYDPASFTKKQWAHPEDAVVFCFQRINFDAVPFWNGEWHVRGLDRARHAILLGKGGHQQLLFHYMQAYSPGIYPNMPFYVENVLEELDAHRRVVLGPRAKANSTICRRRVID